ncbi:hypothetical protein [Aureimonas sp. ME7]|uniref:hypothetical protein n=1 Tax=Aureimonas sp. ME7 TaxID=2744252 RepID=UPI001FCF076F|nr:hypothetical protein [Aureimonas sp. ME7]
MARKVRFTDEAQRLPVQPACPNFRIGSTGNEESFDTELVSQTVRGHDPIVASGKVYVENRQIEWGGRGCTKQGIPHRCSGPDNRVTRVLEDVLQIQRDQRLVFDDQNSQAMHETAPACSTNVNRHPLRLVPICRSHVVSTWLAIHLQWMTSYRFRDLTLQHVRTLLKLDDGSAHADSVGRAVGDLSDDLLIAAYELARIGFVDVSHGWQGTTWFRLTAAGHAICRT